MRLTKLILLLAILLLLPGTALANPQEQFILNQISVGHFDVWQHTNGTWQDTDRDGKADPYGQTGKRVTETYTYPQSQYASQFTPTRVEITKITQASNLTDDELRNAGRSEDWVLFKEKYLRYLPNAYSVTKTGENMAQGTVTVQRIFDLAPKLLNLKDSAVRAELGMTDMDFSDLAQGWRWYTPVLITWYGVPKESKKNCIASAINPGVTGTATPNQKYNGTVTFKYFGDQPVQGVPVGVFNGQYQAVLKDAAGNVVTAADFNPGEKKEFNFTWTAPAEGSATLTGVINVSPLPDLFEETTKDDNKVSVTVNTVPPCTDISVTSMGADSPGVTSGGKITIFFNVKRANDGPQGPVPVKVTLKSAAGNRTWDITLGRGQSELMEATFTLSGSSGTVRFTAEAWPQGVEDCKPGNNRATFDAFVEAPLNLPKVEDEGTKSELIS